MKVLGVIPSRWGSERFPGKPLAMIAGKPLLQWVIEGSKKSQRLDQLIVATDNEKIRQLAESLSIEVAMTSSELPTGSDRVWAAAKDRDFTHIINIQGDEPLVDGETIDKLVTAFDSDPQLEMATLAKKMNPIDLQTDTTAKIVLNHEGNAIYFSRFPIPYSRDQSASERGVSLKHIGLYAYEKSFLKKYCSVGPTPLELSEGLEQLRALYLGAKIRVIQVEHESWGVDRPEDIERVENLLRGQNG
ncbi:MAG: 3-deoxy-manno-octulosonate cytidylyltransferase [Bdellovibrionales bacterium]|nr:3-deoxy-manno-octulosonate cytidylyltransferase [Bdellovibrionales bacterium]